VQLASRPDDAGGGRAAGRHQTLRAGQSREALVMSDVKVERKEALSRDEAARWLALISRAFTADGHAELPFGPSSVSLYIPDQVRAELEVEVDGDEVEMEVEFKWSMAEHEAASANADTARAPVKARQRKTRKAQGPQKARKR
jgi:amphi-Trp domain-containing protein